MFESLIAQNIELRQQILSTAATIAQTQKISIGGEEVTGSLNKIQAATGEVTRQIKQLRQDSLELTGTTSTELVGVFQSVAQQAGSLNFNLKQSEKTTIALAAAGATLGLQGQQIASQSASIARGEIDSYNSIAKSIGLNNEILRQKASEGKLYDFILKKTEALREAQGLAADAFSGVSSNLKEIFENLTQLAGEPLLDTVLKALNSLYKLLSQNLDGIKQIIGNVSDFFVSVGQRVEQIAAKLAPAGKLLAEALGQNIDSVARLAANGISVLLDVVAGAVDIIAPFATAFAQVLKAVSDLAASPLGKFVTELTLTTAAAIQLLGPLSTLATVTLPAFAGGLTAALPALIPFIATAAAAAAPFVLLAAAIAAVKLPFDAARLKAVNEAIEGQSKATNLLADESLGYAQKLKGLNDAAKFHRSSAPNSPDASAPE